MFTKNEFYTEYIRLIDEARVNPQVGPTEVHHIIPRSMDGTDDKENLIRVTVETHMKLHVLLPFFTTGRDYESMIYAWNILTNHGKLLSFGDVVFLREQFSKIQSGRMAGENNPSYKAKENGNHWNQGRKHSKEVNDKKSRPGEQNGMFGKNHTDAAKETMSKAKLSNQYAKGHKPSNELKAQWSKAHKRQGTCIYCGRTMNISNLTRYHNNNCKQNPTKENK